MIVVCNHVYSIIMDNGGETDLSFICDEVDVDQVIVFI
jgi:hypothetical protein